jgi:hypothetical protein
MISTRRVGAINLQLAADEAIESPPECFSFAALNESGCGSSIGCGMGMSGFTEIIGK